MNRLMIGAVVILLLVFGSLLWRGGVFLPPAEIEAPGSACIEPDGLQATHIEFSPGTDLSYEDQEVRIICGRLVTLCSGSDARISIHSDGVLVRENLTENRSVIVTDELPAGSYEIRCSIGSYQNSSVIERLERPPDEEVAPWGISTGTETSQP